PGSGKTNFCILAAASQAKKGNKVIFIDTEGGFSPERVRQIVGDDYGKILENFLMLEPKSFEEQKRVFKDLLNRVKKEHVGLIIVDSMAMLYRLELGDAQRLKETEAIQQVNREVAAQMRVLAEIARNEDIAVLITNQVYKGYQSEEDWKSGKQVEMNIVGGDLFKYWSKAIIELRIEGSRRKVVLLKHRSLPEKELSFEIRNKGIFKRSWL
ncbi:MAG: DNA repair and recombination protein RadB, partial [Nanoarchaeota archaeon]|nr:DNA repair and recombination protein RadB [Nanoarchaeota archaeon]